MQKDADDKKNFIIQGTSVIGTKTMIICDYCLYSIEFCDIIGYSLFQSVHYLSCQRKSKAKRLEYEER